MENDIADTSPVLQTTIDSRFICAVCFKSVALATHKRN